MANKKDNQLVLMRIGDGDVGGEYVTRYGKVLQIVSKDKNSVRVHVVYAGKETTVSKDYEVYEYNEELMGSCKSSLEVQGNTSFVETPPVDMQTEIDRSKENKAKKAAKKKQSGSEDKPLTAKKLVWDLLKEGEQTRSSLAQALIDNKLTKHTTVKKTKAYVSVILSNLKKKNGVKIESVEPGRYRLVKD
jgi:hypothetical protein